MIYNIENINDFNQAISQSHNGDIINGNDIKLELKSTRYTLNRNLEFRNIIFDKVWPNVMTERYVTFEILNKAGLTLTDCKFTPSNESINKRTCYIKATDASYLEVERCVFNRANYMGIHCYDVPHTVVRDSDFNYDSPQGYGYGIWQGGKGNSFDQELKVYDSRFRKTRHAVDGHHNPNHIHVENCDFWENVQQVLNRHSESYGVGGGNYTVIGNRFHDPFTGPVDVQVPLNGKTITVYNNIFNRIHSKNLKLEAIVNDVHVILNETHSHPQLAWGVNHYIN